MSDTRQTFRVYGSWKGLTATSGEISSSFSNLRLEFSAPVADGGQPGFTSPEEMLLGTAVSALSTALVDLCLQMAIDLAELTVEADLIRDYSELDGNVIKEIKMRPTAKFRTGLGFEKVHDMWWRAVARAPQVSPVLRALNAVMRVKVEPAISGGF
ncbi:MAG: OsmC family protein [Mycobacterium leprae]